MTEQALIFANGEINDGPAVRRALAAAPHALIIAADGGAGIARHFGLTVGDVIGDMDSLSSEELTVLKRDGAKLHRYPEAKNETDLELALLWAVEQGATWIRIIGALGGRLDQMVSNVYLLALPALRALDVRLVASNQEAWLVQTTETTIEGAPGDTVSLIPLSGSVEGVRTENLFYPLRGETLTFGPARGVSNVMSADRAHVWLREGTLLVVHTIGRA